MVPTLQAPRYSDDEFWTDCVKPGPKCYLDSFLDEYILKYVYVQNHMLNNPLLHTT